MKFSTHSLIVIAATAAVPTDAHPPASSIEIAVRDFPWTPAGPGDSRSPCPGINTLANHGLIPHNGRNITVAMVISAVKAGYNFGPDFGTFVGGSALLAQNANRLAGTFDLVDVDEHNFPIEQDASLTRADYYFGDDHSFNQTIFDSVLALYGAGTGNLSTTIHGRAHGMRVQASRATNPTFLYGARQYVASYIRDATGLAAMGGPSGNAPVSWYRYWITEERLPYELGWTVPAQQTDFDTLAVTAAQLASADPWDLALVDITVDTVKDVFALKDPITGIVATPSNP